MKKAVFWILVAVVVFILFPGVALLVERSRGKRQLRDAEVALRAKGEKLTIPELVPPRLAGTNNGFAALMSAIRQVPRFEPASQSRFSSPGRLVVTTQLKEWPVGYGSTATTNTWEEAADWAADAAGELAVLRAATQAAAFDAALDFRQGFNLLLPHLSEIKRAAQVLNTAALVEVRAGNTSAALANLRAGCALDKVLRDEPLLISQLVRVAGSSIALNGIWHALHTREWTGPELAQMQAMLPPTDHIAALARAMEMERAMILPAVEAIREGKLDVFSLMTGGSPGAGPANGQDFLRMAVNNPEEVFVSPVVGTLWRFALLDQGVAHYQLTMQRLIESTRKGDAEKSWRSFESQELSKDLNPSNPGERMRHWVTYTTLPAFERTALKPFRLETQRNLTEAALAIRRHQLRHGALPSSLGALVPEFLPAVPVDFMDGQPLRYRLNADGTFVLWSVGDDSVDDGGNPEPKEPAKKTTSLYDSRDMVWPRPATREELEAAGKPKPDGRRSP